MRQYPIDVREGVNPFNSAWRTKDGRYIQTCMPNYNQYYNTFIAAVGRPDLVDKEEYFPIANCQKNGLTTEVYDIVMAAFQEKDVAEWKEILTAADIPFGVCQTWYEILNDPQAEANNCFYEMQYDNGNTRKLVRPPVRFHNMGNPEYKRGPHIGEQGVEVMKELGYSDEEIQEMLASGALYVWEGIKK